MPTQEADKQCPFCGVAVTSLVDDIVEHPIHTSCCLMGRLFRRDAWNRRHVPESVELQPGGITDQDLIAAWKRAGGEFHGPNIETGTMPQAQLLPFLRGLVRLAEA